MKYEQLSILTLRQPPNNARSVGFASLVRAGYFTREHALTDLGKYTIDQFKSTAARLGAEFLKKLKISLFDNNANYYFELDSGSMDLILCNSCNYADTLELAKFKKVPPPTSPLLPLEKIATPECNSIESLASFLRISKAGTAKAMMFTEPAGSKFYFVVLRGDMQLSEAKLKEQIGPIQPASPEEILKIGAVPGYASPIGLDKLMVIVDDLVPGMTNLVAGANEHGYHYLNANYGRDFQADLITDLVMASEGDACVRCGEPLRKGKGLMLSARGELDFENILLALAECYHDDQGLILPEKISPFDVYLLHLPSSRMDTHAVAEQIHESLQDAGVSVLYDDREVSAGVKFKDADLIGIPLRITVGERNLKDGMVELKHRPEAHSNLIDFEQLKNVVNRAELWSMLARQQTD